MKFKVLAEVNWWLWLCTVLLGLLGLVFVHSATQDRPDLADQHGKQALYLACSLGLGCLLLLPHYGRVRRLAWPLYVLAVSGLLGLWLFAPVINGARRWYTLPGFSVQPSEFAKPAVVVALAALLRFKGRSRTFDGLLVPMLVAGLPALLVLKQPDLGSSLVFWPVLLAMCYAAGAPTRGLLVVMAVGVLGAVLAYFTVFHDYQKERVDVWFQHFGWTDADVLGDPHVRAVLWDAGYQPWQALVAMGGGGYAGFGIGQGPQNRYDFLPYRSEDYLFAVVGEETGWLGCALVLLLFMVLVLGLLAIAVRTRERFGRLLCVGVAAWLGAQALIHAAVCGWMVPATGLPMPLLSYGGSATLAAVLGIALCLNVGARREPVFAGDGFQ
ncbi:MAG TPA: FtsW/RodA/SpoVE family cell cycle protein [Planctomycetota bacterium]|nr:FtsW/RodA/SpoVE family cell cycle protein [Planctomycetota bacterium]